VTIAKEVRETIRSYDAVAEVASQYNDELGNKLKDEGQTLRIEDIPILISALEKDMKDLAKVMEFEKAAEVRDKISDLRKMMGVSDGKIGVTSRRKDPRRRSYND